MMKKQGIGNTFCDHATVLEGKLNELTSQRSKQLQQVDSVCFTHAAGHALFDSVVYLPHCSAIMLLGTTQYQPRIQAFQPTTAGKSFSTSHHYYSIDNQKTCCLLHSQVNSINSTLSTVTGVLSQILTSFLLGKKEVLGNRMQRSHFP